MRTGRRERKTQDAVIGRRGIVGRMGYKILILLALIVFLSAGVEARAAYFSDDMEGAPKWAADPPWALTTSDKHSGAQAWTDSPGGYYGNSQDVSLTLITSIDLTAAVTPQLVFWHKYQIEAEYDYGYVELSTDNGATWPYRLAAFTGISGGGAAPVWKREQLDLTPYAGQANVKIRFRLVTDKTIVWDGWTVDDVSVGEPPNQTAVFNIGNPKITSLDLTWSKSLDADFASYKIYRSTSAGISPGSTLVATITDPNITTYTDTGLLPGTVYYYKIYTVNSLDLYAPGKEASLATIVSFYSYPFFDDMESGVGGWTAAAPWGLTSSDRHSGQYCWTDSPAGPYGASTDSSLEIKVDLGPAIMPVLSFWHRYIFDPNVDYGYVEVKEDGTSTWNRIYAVTGTQAAWVEEKVDLSSYAGKKVYVRFRLISDGSNQADGWYIDDVRIGETQSPVTVYPFRDTMDLPAAVMNWHSSSWSLVPDSHSGTYAYKDSPTGKYGDQVWSELILANSMNLQGAVHPQLSFWHKYNLTNHNGNYGEYSSCNNNYNREHDYGIVYLSTYNGQAGTWTELARYTGSADWKQEKIDLSAWAGLPNVRIKFVLYDQRSENFSNCNNRLAGWTIDDVIIENAPLDVILTLTSSTMNTVDLSWTENADNDFNRYEIYRYATAGVTRNNTLVASVAQKTTLTYKDAVAMVQPGSYYYRVWVVDADGNVSPGSNEVHATYTVPANTYPFVEDGEAGSAKWSWGSPWGQVALPAGETHTGQASTVWTDSPGANYPANADTTLTTFINMSGSTNPVLSFWHKYSLEQAKDFVKLEVSTDNGQTWSVLRSFTGTETAWSQERINLAAYTGQANLGLRFHLTSDGTGQQDGWFMDDLIIQEEAVSAPYPFTDGAETGPAPWFYTSPWGRTTEDYHSGNYSWSCSPGATYAPSADTSLQVAIDLGSANMPVLSFWQKYAFDTNADFGYVEVREAGSSSWQRIYFVTGTQVAWAEARVDLSIYAGKQIDLRFRVVADGSTEADGWHIDDIRIGETQSAELIYPFKDSLDTAATLTNWHSASWSRVPDSRPGAGPGSMAFTDSAAGPYGALTNSRLVLANILDMRTAIHPQLTFWHKYETTNQGGNYGEYSDCGNNYNREHDYGIVYLSTYNGQAGTWKEIGRFNGQAAWKREQIDLSTWAGLPNVRIAFVMNDNKSENNECTTRREGWTLDDIFVEDAPKDVSLAITSSSMNSVALSWTANADVDFNRYELYRSPSPGVTRGATLVATIPAVGTTTYTDPVALVQPGTYFYRLWVIDADGNVSMGSNEVQATYTIPANSYPFSEGGEAGTARWAFGTPWGLTDVEKYSGIYSWTDSPGTNYAANANTSLSTFLNLNGSTNPILTFWHKYLLETGKDFVKLEVSTNNGQDWTVLKSYTGVETGWSQERIDLSAYTGNANLGLRFRLTSDAANQQDGWYMDDLKIEEGAVLAAYPFHDSMENGPSPWFYDSPWSLVLLPGDKTRTGLPSVVWADSPSASYAKSADASLYLTIDLGSANMPLLSFWQRYAFEDNSDYGYLEVKEVGSATWKRLYFVTGTSPSWVEAKVDLSNYAGKQVNLRFRVVADASDTQSDGWFIDDVRIAETTQPPVAYPFFDNLDGGMTQINWFPGNWSLVSSVRNSVTSLAFVDSPLGKYGDEVQPELILSNTIDLRGAVHPQLSFWHLFEMVNQNGNYGEYSDCGNNYNREHDYGIVYLSTYNGQSGTWKEIGRFTGTQSTWKEEKISLSSWVGLPNIRIKFVLNDNRSENNNCNSRRAGWTLDEIRIGEDAAIPSFIQKISGDGQNGETGKALAQPFTARIYDSDSRPRAGIVVDFAVVGGDGTLSAASATSDANGFVSTVLTLGAVSGTNTVSATIRDSSPVQTVVFSAAAYGAGQAMTMSKVSGDGQVGVVGTALANPLVVRVTDISGQPVAGVNVTFTKIAGDATLAVTTPVATDDGGYAANTLNLGAATGSVSVTAAATGLVGSPAGFTAYAVLQGGVLGDTDGDGMPDAWELANGLDPKNAGDAALDPDGDGLANLAEYSRGTNPQAADTDGDGMPDGWEVQYRLNPLDPSDAARDANGDGITNLRHYQAGTVPIKVRHFQVAAMTSRSVAVYGTLTINGLPAEVGDEVAVLDPAGVICGQFTVTTPGQYGFMSVYGDDGGTTADEGAQPGDVLRFRVWKAATGVEVDAVATVVTGTQPPTWTSENDILHVNLDASGKYVIPLHAGWNLISFPLKTCFYADGVSGAADGPPGEPMLTGTVFQKVAGIGDVFASIAGKYDVIRSFDSKGAHTFLPDEPTFSTMKYVAGGYGYWIKMKEAANLELIGLKAAAADSLALHSNWNLVGCWHPDVRYTGPAPTVAFPAGTGMTQVNDIGSVLQAIQGDYAVVRTFDIQGGHTYDPALGSFNNLKYLGPGYGMWIKMNTVKDLSY